MTTRTFLFTDIEGSTSLLRRLGGDVYSQMLVEHHALIRSALAAHGGAELTTTGDGFFAAFASPRECVAGVLEMQRGIRTRAWPAGEQVRVRMGVHTGEAEESPAGPVGLDVHRAARIAGVAHGGQVLLSEAAAALLRDSLPTGAGLRDLGVHRLKDLGRPERLFQLTAAGLGSDFPPLRSLGNPTLLNNLPVELSTFIGRDAEVKQVRSLVESARLVTLTGSGGAGKTRLSLQAAAELLDETGDGVWLVELATVTDPGAVPSAIAAVLGISAQPGREILDTLTDALVPQRLLIVLDNCEHLIDACAKTADAILRRCPHVHLLATSREPLGIAGETIYRVPSLSLPPEDEAGSSPAELSDAVVLFLDRARQQGVSLTVDEHTGPLITSVCRRLDGMPLAIELAAARLRSLSLTELASRLDQRFRLLTGGSRAALARQQTLLATVAWSYSLLTSLEQLLLRRLAVFPESFDLAAAEAVCGSGPIDRIDVIDLLGSLVDKSLVGTEHGAEHLRYRLLETIRQFAADRLLEAGDDGAVQVGEAHCEHFLAVAEAGAAGLDGPDQADWFARLDADRANLWRAVEHAAAAPGGTTRALRFGAALRRYWPSRRAHEAVVCLLGPVIERPGARSDLPLFVGAALTVADCLRMSRPRDAMQLTTELIELARHTGEPRQLIEALAGYCGMCYFNGEPEKGQPFGAEAVGLARKVGSDVLLAGAIMGYLLCHDLLDPDDSELLYAEAIACAQRTGDRQVAGLLRNNASVHSIRQGDFATARAHLLQAAEAAAEIGEENHVILVNLGWVLRQEHDPEAARAEFETGLRRSRRSGDKYIMAYSCMGLACVESDLGDWQHAAELHGVAQAFLDLGGEPWQEPEVEYRRESIDKARERLGAGQFEAAYARGSALSFDDAVDLALSHQHQAAA
jgi:predicted ATPase/class 3 adenylate cyclase